MLSPSLQSIIRNLKKFYAFHSIETSFDDESKVENDLNQKLFFMISSPKITCVVFSDEHTLKKKTFLAAFGEVGDSDLIYFIVPEKSLLKAEKFTEERVKIIIGRTFSNCILTEDNRGEYRISQEKKNIMKFNYVDISELPRILPTDPVCVWLMAASGDLIEITTPAINGTYNITYRYVI